MFCKNCGKELSDNALFCPACGCPTEVQAPQEKAPAPLEEEKVNILCIIGFVLSIVSWFLSLIGLVAIASLILCILGLVQTKKFGTKCKGLGIAGIPIAAVSIIYTVYALILLQLA